MKLEIFAICDAAKDYRGKTCIMGTFDTIAAPTAPAKHHHLSIIAKIRFHTNDAPSHTAEITFIDADGKPIVPPFKQEFQIGIGDHQHSRVGNLIVNINGLKLPKFGEYRVDLRVDGNPLGELPLYFVQIPQHHR